MVSRARHPSDRAPAPRAGCALRRSGRRETALRARASAAASPAPAARRTTSAARDAAPCAATPRVRPATRGQGGNRRVLNSAGRHARACWRDRKSTRLNSSHVKISYAVFCLKKKKKKKKKLPLKKKKKKTQTTV